MDNENFTDNVQETGSAETWRIYREAARAEYEYAHVSSNRLDNKVYILLVVCAFLFPVLYSVRFETAGFMSSWPVCVLTVIKFLPLVCLSAAIVVADKALILIIISVVLFLCAVLQQEAIEIRKGGEARMSIDYSREITKEEAEKMTADELLEYSIKTGKAPPRMPTTRELMKSKYFIFPGVNRKD